MDNLYFYNAGREVPKEAQKPFNNGKFSGTDINPMWRIKKLTELFGPAGIGWYVDEVTERSEIHGETTISIVNLNLYVKVDGEWSKPIYGTGGNVLLRKGTASDEGYKMAYTDALSVACKALGIGADIWFANDQTKYTARNDTAEPKAAPAKEKPAVVPPGSPAYEAPKEAPPAEELKKEPAKYECLRCGKIIKPIKRKDGSQVGARQWSTFTEKHYGQCLCWSCTNSAYPDWTQFGDELA